MKVLLAVSLLVLFVHDGKAMDREKEVLLKARYTQVEGTDPEYGQGAIERNDLRHREITHFVWLILVDAPGDCAEWEEKLNAAVDPRHGSFRVERATEEETRKVESGEITLQR